jgi:hypothetical protein
VIHKGKDNEKISILKYELHPTGFEAAWGTLDDFINDLATVNEKPQSDYENSDLDVFKKNLGGDSKDQRSVVSSAVFQVQRKSLLSSFLEDLHSKIASEGAFRKQKNALIHRNPKRKNGEPAMKGRTTKRQKVDPIAVDIKQLRRKARDHPNSANSKPITLKPPPPTKDDEAWAMKVQARIKKIDEQKVEKAEYVILPNDDEQEYVYPSSENEFDEEDGENE